MALPKATAITQQECTALGRLYWENTYFKQKTETKDVVRMVKQCSTKKPPKNTCKKRFWAPKTFLFCMMYQKMNSYTHRDVWKNRNESGVLTKNKLKRIKRQKSRRQQKRNLGRHLLGCTGQCMAFGFGFGFREPNPNPGSESLSQVVLGIRISGLVWRKRMD